MDERHIRIEFDANGVVTSLKPAKAEKPETQEPERPEKEERSDHC